MAATDVPVQTITETGMVPAAAVNGDNTNGNSFANTGAQWVEWTNTAGVSGTWSVSFPNLVKGQTVPAKSFTVAAAAVHRAGPFDPAVYGSTVVMTPSASTMKPAVFQWAR
jgi:hypothetical protein